MDTVYIRSFSHFFHAICKNDTTTAAQYGRICTRILLRFRYAPMLFFHSWDIQPIHRAAL